MLKLLLRLGLHWLTIFISMGAGIIAVAQQHQPHFWDRQGSYLALLPAMVAAATWFRSFMSNLVNGGTADDVSVYLFLLEKLLVAYLAFAAGAALGLMFTSAF